MRVMISGDITLKFIIRNPLANYHFLTLMSSSSFYNNYNITNQMLTQISLITTPIIKKIRDRNWSRIFDVCLKSGQDN